MNIKQIEIFHSVMMAGSVSGAARLLYISTPAVSRALSHTESRLGFLLFRRIKGRLYPTHEAKILAKKIDPICRDIVEIDRLCKDLKSRKEGFINVVASVGLGQLFLPLAISRFYRKYHQIRIHYENLRHGSIKESILKQNADFGISTLPIDYPDLEVIPLARGRIFMVCPLSHPLANYSSVSIKDIAQFSLISYPNVTPWGEKIEAVFEKRGCTPSINVEVETPQNAFAMVNAGLGIALVDEFSLLAWGRHGISAVVVSDEKAITASLLYLHNQPLTPKTQKFIGIIKQLVQEFNL